MSRLAIRSEASSEVASSIPWITYVILSSTLVVFFWQITVAHKNGGRDLVGAWLAFGPHSLAEHRSWTLLTYGWVHTLTIFGRSDLFYLHVLVNLLALFALGPLVEAKIGHLSFVGLYLLGTIAAAGGWYFLTPATSHHAIVGASGAVFSLIAAAGTALPHRRIELLLFFVVPLTMSLQTMSFVLCGLELLFWLTGLLPQIGHSAHLVGAATGYLYINLFFRLKKSSARG